jgi:putative peptidoglycan lipid II flippase
VAVQALILLVPLRRAGIPLRLGFGRRRATGSRLGRVAGWTLAAAMVSQLGYVVTSNVSNGAAAQGAAGRTIYDNAYLVFMLPHSLVTVSLVTALFTRLSRSAARGDAAAVRSDISGGLRILALATMLATAGMIALAPEVAGVLYPGNSAEETEALARVLRAMALGIVPIGAQHLLQRGFYAFQDARTPFLVQIVVVLVAASVALAGARTLRPHWVVAGVGLGLSLGLTAGALLSARLLRRHVAATDEPAAHSTYLRLLAAAVPAAVSARLVASASSRLGDGYAGQWLGLVLGGLVLALTYAVLCRALRVRELEIFRRLAVSRVRRRPPTM